MYNLKVESIYDTPVLFRRRVSWDFFVVVAVLPPLLCARAGVPPLPVCDDFFFAFRLNSASVFLSVVRGNFERENLLQIVLSSFFIFVSCVLVLPWFFGFFCFCCRNAFSCRGVVFSVRFSIGIVVS